MQSYSHIATVLSVFCLCARTVTNELDDLLHFQVFFTAQLMVMVSSVTSSRAAPSPVLSFHQRHLKDASKPSMHHDCSQTTRENFSQLTNLTDMRIR